MYKIWNTPTEEELARIPKLYETENIPLKDKIIHIHFFIGGCDWYIAEYPPEEEVFWGYAILNGDIENAVKTQIWIGITVYVLVAIVKKKLKLEQSLYAILQILSVAVFAKTPSDRALARTDCTDQNYSTPNQLQLFD